MHALSCRPRAAAREPGPRAPGPPLALGPGYFADAKLRDDSELIKREYVPRDRQWRAAVRPAHALSRPHHRGEKDATLRQDAPALLSRASAAAPLAIHRLPPSRRPRGQSIGVPFLSAGRHRDEREGKECPGRAQCERPSDRRNDSSHGWPPKLVHRPQSSRPRARKVTRASP
jgi:hypothetical protein